MVPKTYKEIIDLGDGRSISIETGKFDPSLKLVIKITRFFKTDLESIFIFEESI